MRTRALLTTPLLLLALGTTACEVSGSVDVGKKVSSSELEKQVTEKLKGQIETTKVDCPDGLKGKVGATTTCTVDTAELRYTATVKATKVDGSTVSFDLKMPPPATMTQAVLEKKVATTLADQVPGGVTSVTCESDLVGTVGETATCTVTPGTGDPVKVATTVTQADFTSINFSIKSVG